MVVGAGLIGLASAWWLSRRGHRVVLMDAGLERPTDPDAGSAAALGLLMAQVFHRSSGRSWRLRQRSQALWPVWREALAAEGTPLPHRQGLLFLAGNATELARQQQLATTRQRQGINLEVWSEERLRQVQPALPATALGALHSPDDGQLDPPALIAALLAGCRRQGVGCLSEAADALERCRGGWRLHGSAGTVLDTDWLVVAAGMGSAALLASLGLEVPLEPVLGQALELELAGAPDWEAGGWPGAVTWCGINLVPRPDLPGGRRLWLGASLEPGRLADPQALARLRRWEAATPIWLEQARVVRHWQGLRCKPCGRPAPLLEQPAAGLLIASGHYRNGVLLAPATAEWVAAQVEAAERHQPA